MSYSYVTGKINRLDKESVVTVADVLSNRHLRSILMYIWDYVYLMNHQQELDDYNTLLHKRLSVPLLKTSAVGTGNEKKWFKVDNVSIRKGTIHMTGILSVTDRDYFDQPIVASCIFDYKRNTFKWEFQVLGVNIKREGQEYIDSNDGAGVNVRNLFRILTELELSNFCNQTSNENPYDELSKKIVKKLKQSEFHVCSQKESGTGLWELMEFIIKRVVEVNDDEVVFEVCDMHSPTSTLVYDRLYHGLHLKKKKTYRKDKCDYSFIHNADGNIDKFLEVIKMIDKLYPLK